MKILEQIAAMTSDDFKKALGTFTDEQRSLVKSLLEQVMDTLEKGGEGSGQQGHKTAGQTTSSQDLPGIPHKIGSKVYLDPELTGGKHVSGEVGFHHPNGEITVYTKRRIHQLHHSNFSPKKYSTEGWG